MADDAGVEAPLSLKRSSRRAHLGGRSAGGKMQAIFARRQFEHGDCLSHRTLRFRHTTQLRNLGGAAEVEWDPLDAVGVTFSVGAEVYVTAGGISADVCGMLQLFPPTVILAECVACVKFASIVELKARGA